MIALGKVRVTYVIRPIVKKSPIFGLFYVRRVEEEIIQECMEIIGKERQVLRYLRDAFFVR